MAFKFSESNIKENQLVFVYEECAYSGVRKVAGLVRDDIEAVFSAKPIGVEYDDFHDTAGFFDYPVFFGTVGNSAVLDALAAQGAINLFDIAGESEVYSLCIVDGLKFNGFTFESAIVIAGSDKRGTIYGLFRLSEMIGISPFTGWLDVYPVKLSELVLTKSDSVISHTPSVKYRGFFINDEWPAFGNFVKKNFGGFNAKAYEHVFELLLRLKGNYLWPAMWSSVFSDDGPGLKSCRLADELGVIMGTSHHEPCMRQGEEYSHVRGPESVYGDAWDFRANREGIIRFWKDGIEKRSAFENVYTVGMRGEADTAICTDGSLSDNIDLLKDVIRTQNRLLSEGLGKDAGDIPRLLVLYKEVEPFFYGDDKVQGLCDDPELDGITLMLCDDNFGNLRTVPRKDNRMRPGGWGMYYHLDYHGWPVSYEWFNTSALSKIWEQMTYAYDNGIRQTWIANVGDIFTSEYPLSFFMEMAYDFDRWGTSDRNSPAAFTKKFAEWNFPALTDEDRADVERLLTGYTKITSLRRTEAMNDRVYAPFAYGECEHLLGKCEELMSLAKSMYKRMPEEAREAFFETVYVPVCGNLNVQKMWALTTRNHAYAQMGSTVANSIADEIKDCIRFDRKLTDKVHKGKWYGMAMSEHIGFVNWCEEECRYPVTHIIEPASKPRIIVVIPETGEHTEGGFWSKKTLTLPSCLDPLVCGGYIELDCATSGKVQYTLSSQDEFIDIVDAGKSVREGKNHRVFILVDRMKIEDEYACGRVRVSFEDRTVDIDVPVNNPKDTEELPENTYIYCGMEGFAYSQYISIAAEHYAGKDDTEQGSFEVIPDYGRSRSALKAYPQDVYFTPAGAPSVTYSVLMKELGRYVVRVYSSCANPCHEGRGIVFGIATSTRAFCEIDTIPEGYMVGDGKEPWSTGVLCNGRITDVSLDLQKGINDIKIFALSPGFVLEKIVIVPEGVKLPYSYLGPGESFHT